MMKRGTVAPPQWRLPAGAVCGLLLVAAPVAAQSAAMGGSACPALRGLALADTAAGRPALVIVAGARARELRFERSLRMEVRLLGGEAGDTTRIVQRRNLPGPVQPGTTYTDVAVAVEVADYLNVQCLLPRPGADTIRTRARSGALPTGAR